MSINALANKGRIDNEINSNIKFNELKKIIFLNLDWNFFPKIFIVFTENKLI